MKRREMPSYSVTMAALYFVAVLMLFPFASNAEEKTAKSGDDVTLQCQSPRGETFRLLTWIRPDLKTDGYVFFFRENRSYEDYQLPSFHGRVQLRDPEMKNGDISVILKNVTISDTGTYQCNVSVNKGLELMNTINLKVEDSAHTAYFERHSTEGDEDGNMRGRVGLVVGLSIVGGVLLADVLIFRKFKSKKQNSYESRAEKSET